VDEEGKLNLDFGDEIIRETVVSLDGDVPHSRMRDLLGMAEIPAPAAAEPETTAEKA